MSRLPALLRRVGRWLWALMTWRWGPVADGDYLQVIAGHQALAPATGKDFYAQDTDPGAVGTGSVWKDTSVPPFSWWERNDTDDGWNAFVRVTGVATGVGIADVSTTAVAVDGAALASSAAEATGEGVSGVQITAVSVIGEALAFQSATTGADGLADVHAAASSVDGIADAHTAATATGTGIADTTATSTTLSGDATSGIKAVRDGVEASVLVDVTDTTVRVRAVATDISLTATDDITLTATTGITLTGDGGLTLSPASGIDLDVSVIMAGSLPEADPEVAGQLYTDGAYGPGAPVALMVSGGPP